MTIKRTLAASSKRSTMDSTRASRRSRAGESAPATGANAGSEYAYLRAQLQSGAPASVTNPYTGHKVRGPMDTFEKVARAVRNETGLQLTRYDIATTGRKILGHLDPWERIKRVEGALLALQSELARLPRYSLMNSEQVEVIRAIVQEGLRDRSAADYDEAKDSGRFDNDGE
jgi:hypothetical protein